MVDCPRVDIRDALPDLVHDQLEPSVRARVEEHLRQCAECAAEVELLRALRSRLFATPHVDVERVAAAVRASATPGSADDVVSISAARQLRPERVARPTRRPTSHGWRIAAGIALFAAGVGGYALSRGGTPSPQRTTESAAVSVASAPSPAPAAKAGAPMSAPATPSSVSGFSSAADAAAGVGSQTPGGLILEGPVSDLSESDMQALLQTVGDLEAMPDLDPHPLPLLARLAEGAL